MGILAQYCCAEREDGDKLPKLMPPDKPLRREKSRTKIDQLQQECLLVEVDDDDGKVEIHTPRHHMDNYTKFRKSLPFSRMHVRHFFKQVKDIRKDKFTSENLKQQLKSYSWKEYHWNNDSEMMLLLSSLPKSKGNFFNRRDLECLALLWCKGTIQEKVEQLYETLYCSDLQSNGQTFENRRSSAGLLKHMSGSQCSGTKKGEEDGKNDAPLKMIETILTIATKQIVWKCFRHDRNGLSQESFDPDLLKRAIKAMQSMDCDDSDHEYEENQGTRGSQGTRSFVRIFSPNHQQLSREEFFKTMQSDRFNWIFDDRKIRERIRKNLMDEYVLETMGF